MNREDFPMLQKNIIYLDNGATTLKPQSVIEATTDYYQNYTANAHRGDYDLSLKVDLAYEAVREKVRRFIHAREESEIVFTSGATESLNMIVKCFMKEHLQSGDEVLLTKSEHASNLLPWLELAKELGIQIRYIPLTETHQVTMENIKKVTTSKTKVISIAAITNVLGDIRPIHEIGLFCKEHNIYFVVDGAQSAPHIKTDVIEDEIDFFAFSAHKMLGPTGVGVLYGKKELLEEMHPLKVGGGMNQTFRADGFYEYQALPLRLEAGTQNIAGVIAFGEAIDYLSNIGFEKIKRQEHELKEYFLKQSKEVEDLIIYNPDTSSTTIAFNLKDVFAGDTAAYLNTYHICIRAGNHCAKILKDELGVANTCRISFYFYNSKDEIDFLIKVLKNAKNVFRKV